MKNTILAIESSCDDTSASVIKDGKIRSNIIFSQLDHATLGGVVPEIASRAHQKNIVFTVDKALSDAKVFTKDLSAIAFTNGPGLLGSLLVGSSFCKSMAYALNIPLLAVNHLKAHALSHMIDNPSAKFPYLSLFVSGGHTQIILVESYLNMKIVGETKDDAVGEAFDKSAKILGLEYPGGPLIDELAKKGDSQKYKFSKTKISDLDFSFSGIKTSFLYFINDQIKVNKSFINDNIEDIAASIQKSLVDMLMEKIILASKKFKISEISISGGVAANSFLRKTIKDYSKEMKWNVYSPKIEYCTDNAAMIAYYAYFMYKEKLFSNYEIIPEPRLKF
jgi:N6-L-threonylcarbamoyladenine synthase